MVREKNFSLFLFDRDNPVCADSNFVGIDEGALIDANAEIV
ncbi:hypothetical protein PWEIH_06541 [Listeria weihenstephanensis FSL R9-0317]|nr:hypothetical protein PWEIH_06541 [Listeria weihenstephanensis FSL R9-0317]